MIFAPAALKLQLSDATVNAYRPPACLKLTLDPGDKRFITSDMSTAIMHLETVRPSGNSLPVSPRPSASLSARSDFEMDCPNI